MYAHMCAQMTTLDTQFAQGKAVEEEHATALRESREREQEAERCLSELRTQHQAHIDTAQADANHNAIRVQALDDRNHAVETHNRSLRGRIKYLEAQLANSQAVLASIEKILGVSNGFAAE